MITVLRKPPLEHKTLIIDAPWKMCSGGSKHINPKDHYPVQTQEEIIATCKAWLKQNPMAEESHCYIWGINSFSTGGSRGMLDAIDLCEQLGFTPCHWIPWIKTNNGNPAPFGQRYIELILFGAKWRKGQSHAVMYKGNGKENTVALPTMSKTVDYILSPRSDHSRKPLSFYEYVETRSAPPYLEFYSRTRRFNWTVLGNEIGNFE